MNALRLSKSESRTFPNAGRAHMYLKRYGTGRTTPWQPGFVMRREFAGELWHNECGARDTRGGALRLRGDLRDRPRNGLGASSATLSTWHPGDGIPNGVYALAVTYSSMVYSAYFFFWGCRISLFCSTRRKRLR
jgi:hypothetical protein